MFTPRTTHARITAIKKGDAWYPDRDWVIDIQGLVSGVEQNGDNWWTFDFKPDNTKEDLYFFAAQFEPVREAQ